MWSLLAVAAVLSAGIVLLAVIVRFAVISPRRTRGARERLRAPDMEGVERACGFAPPAELASLYRDSPLVDQVECELVDARIVPPRVWPVGEFIPMSEVDVDEARRIHGTTDAIPIADDLDKGVYVVTRAGTVVLRSHLVPDGAALVAESVAELGTFTVRRD